MSTTNISESGSRVVELAAIKMRRRLENLLYTRKRVAQLAAEHRSHGLDDAVELYQLQLEVEQTIADEFPAAFETRIGTWAEDEVAFEHHPQVPSAACSICEAIARHGGGTDSPLAA